ncbi:BTAD domain-containing putative transcriptional regulator [Streptomyces sp. bgisy091]|uniref:BTAD domain-containing putative transcriptional regulator n=1 Tax=Streptomyces sp. bgisy091 TaxID=3413778 RepID=UPI003D73B3A7
MEFRLLGSFDVWHEGRRVSLDSRRQERCLLAALLLHEGKAVTVARLTALLWGLAPPGSARGTLHTYIGRLRAVLAPLGVAVETVRDAYRIELGGHSVDAHSFTDLVRRAGRTAEPSRRVALYDEALALWRGPLLADAADEAVRERLGGDLAALRLTTVEERAAEHLGLGLHDRVIRDLTPLAAEHPDREGLSASLMTALNRSGRRAEALALYRSTHRALVDGLGIEPGGALQDLHARTLRGDRGLDHPAGPPHAVRVDGEWLPWTTGGHPALEFCNTWAGWGGPSLPGSEWLRSFRALAVWAWHHGLAEKWALAELLRHAGEHPDEADSALGRARVFRARLYACLTDPGDARAFTDVAAVVDRAAVHTGFVLGEDGLGHWQTRPKAGLDLPLYAVARSAACLLADPCRLLVRACPGEGCGWLFADESGRRRWCSLRTCGGSGNPSH